MSSRTRIFAGGLLLAASLTTAVVAQGAGTRPIDPARAVSSAAITGRVVDANGKPVEGVVVVVRWKLDVRIEGNSATTLRIEEAVSGPDGRFTFAAWGPIERPLGTRLNRFSPEFVALKAGVGWTSVRTHPEPDREMYPYLIRDVYREFDLSLEKKGTTDENRLQEYHSTVLPLSNDLFGQKDREQQCLWAKIPKYLVEDAAVVKALLPRGTEDRQSNLASIKASLDMKAAAVTRCPIPESIQRAMGVGS